MSEEKESLSDKMFDTGGVLEGKIFVRDVKEKVQNTQSRLKDYLVSNFISEKNFFSIIEIFKEEFGEKIC